MKRVLLLVAVGLVFLLTSIVEARTPFSLHFQHLQRRARKGYRVPAGFRWYAQTNPGVVGRPNQGYWRGGRYYYYRPRPVYYHYR